MRIYFAVAQKSIDVIGTYYLPNVRDHRHRTAGATSAGSEATKHSACQRVGVRWIAWSTYFLLISFRNTSKGISPKAAIRSPSKLHEYLMVAGEPVKNTI